MFHRREVLRSIAASCIISIEPTINQIENNSTNLWKTFRSDNQHTCSIDAQGPNANISILSEIESDAFTSTSGPSVPVTDGEAVYLTGSVIDIDEIDVTYDIEWETTYSGEGLAAFGDTYLYVHKYTSDGISRVYCINYQDGSTVWKSELVSENDESNGYHTYPLVGEDLVFASPSRGPNASEALYAINKADGSEEWVTVLEGGYQYTPILYDGTLYLGTQDYIYAIDASDGTSSRLINTGTRGPIALKNDQLFVPTRGIQVFDLDGSELWSTSSGSVDFSSQVAVTNEQVFVIFQGRSTSENPPHVAALNIDNGTLNWNYDFDKKYYQYEHIGGPITSSELVYFTVSNGRQEPTVVIGLNKQTGSEILSFELDTGEYSHPSLIRNQLVFASTEGRLVMIGDRQSEEENISVEQNRSTEENSPEQNGSTEDNYPIIRRFSNAADSPVSWALGGIIGSAAAYAGYKKVTTRLDKSDSTDDNRPDN